MGLIPIISYYINMIFTYSRNNIYEIIHWVHDSSIFICKYQITLMICIQTFFFHRAPGGIMDLTLGMLRQRGLLDCPEFLQRLHIFVAHNDPHFAKGCAWAAWAWDLLPSRDLSIFVCIYYLSVYTYLSIYLYLYLVYPSIYPSRCLSIYLPICLSIDHQLNSRIYKVDRLVGWPSLVVVQQGKLGEISLA